jgi:hypothetical protein
MSRTSASVTGSVRPLKMSDWLTRSSAGFPSARAREISFAMSATFWAMS